MANPKIIESDGRTYEFTPGKYGSLVSRNVPVSKPLYTPSTARAKVIVGDTLDKLMMKKKKQKRKTPVLVASPRG